MTLEHGALNVADDKRDVAAGGDGPRKKLNNLDDYIPGVITWIYNRMSSDASQLYRKWYKLGVTDWRVLAFLGVNREGTAASISRYINLDKAATSRSITSLCAQGLINAEQMPGRNIRLTLTTEGHAKFEQISVVALEREAALLHGFSNGERQMLNEMLHRLLANLDRVRAVRPPGAEPGASSPDA